MSGEGSTGSTECTTVSQAGMWRRDLPNRPMRYVLPILRLVLGIALLGFVFSSANNRLILSRILGHPTALLGLAGLPFLGAAIESYRLGLLFRSQGILLPFGKGYRLVAISSFFNLIIPGGTGGDVAKLYYLGAPQKGKRIEVAAVLLVDRVVALCALLLVIVVLALVEADLVQDHAIITWLVGAAIVLIVTFVAGAALFWWPRMRRSRALRYLVRHVPLHRYVERFADALLQFRCHKANLAAALCSSFVGHIALAMMFIVAGSVLIPGADALVVSLLSLLGLLANVLPITPGGLGVGEAAADQLFSAVGLAGGAPLILAWRAGTAPFAALGSLFYVTYSK